MTEANSNDRFLEMIRDQFPQDPLVQPTLSDEEIYAEESLTAAVYNREFIDMLCQLVSSSEQEMSLEEFEALHDYLAQQHQLDRKSAARVIGRCVRLIDSGSISGQA